jgi:hypothetical protein
LETDPAVSMRGELLVAHEKLGQFPAAGRVCCAHVERERNFVSTFETAPFFCVFPVYLGPNSTDVSEQGFSV